MNDILAETFLTTKDYPAALNAINRIQNPGQRVLEAKQMVLFQLGAQEFINGNMGPAIQHFNESIGLGNYDAETRSNAYYWRGESYYRMGNYVNATNDFANSPVATPNNENYLLGWYSLGYSYSSNSNTNRPSARSSNIPARRATDRKANMPMR